MRIVPGFPLGGRKTGYFLCYVVAFGVYLSLLGTLVTTILISAHGKANQPYSVPVIAQLPRESAPEDIEKLLSSVGRVVGVAEVSILAERELHDLVEPWLSKEVLGELPFFPILLEITKDGRVDLDRNKLLTAIQEIPGGSLINLPFDQQERALAPLILHGIMYLALLVLLLLFLSTVILLGVRMSIFLNRETINVLRLLGATELFLVQEFRLNILRVAIMGCSIGSIAAVGTVLFILLAISNLGINELGLSSFNVFLLFLVMMGFLGGPLLTWVLAPMTIGRELSLLKKPRW